MINSKHNSVLSKTTTSKSIFIFIPVAGILLFVVLYFIAARLYPGGNQVDKNAAGFSWKNNYWCNLLNENAINGQHNSAKPVAITGMFILCITLTFFWIVFPAYMNIGNKLKYTIQISGVVAMTIAFFLFTGFNHDLITNLASLSGLVATVGTFAGLYQSKRFKLFAYGLFNITLVALNNYVYYTKGLLIYLPVIQKISFAAFLIWICCICFSLYNDQQKISIYKAAIEL